MTYEEAYQEILSTFQTAWNAGTTAVVGYIPTVVWPNGVADSPPVGRYWARVSIQISQEAQRTLGDGQRRFETQGLVFIQLFGPIKKETAPKELRGLATVARNAFRGNTSQKGVWFRNASLAPLSAEPEWHRFNVTSEFVFGERA